MEIILNPDDFCSRLPDEIIIEILSKVIDLKSLCFCKLVSRRFRRIVNNNVDTVSFSLIQKSKKKQLLIRSLILKPLKFLLCNNNNNNNNKGADDDDDDGDDVADDMINPFKIKSFCSAYTSMLSFSKLRNLRIQLPACAKGIDDNRSCLFKWKVKHRKNSVESFVFLSPNSIYDNNGFLLYRGRRRIDSYQLEGLANDCLLDMIGRMWVLLDCTVNFPLLEKVSVTHSDKRGTVSLGGEKLADLRKCYWSEFWSTGIPYGMSRGYVPLLELPVSGYTMKGVTLILMTDDHHDVVIDRFINNNNDDDDDLEDKLEAAYNEAMMQIFKKHMGLLQRVV